MSLVDRLGNEMTPTNRHIWMTVLRLWAVAAFLCLAGCDLPGIVEPMDPDASLEPETSIPACPAEPRCGGGDFIELCSPDGQLEFIQCGRAESCIDGACEDLTGSCDASQGRPFRLSRAELVFDVPELLADCDCTGPTGCLCSEVDYKSQVRQLTLENCSDRSLFIVDIAVKDNATRPDGDTVFALDRSYREVEIPPGRSQDINVFYRPAPGVSQLSASDLDISLIGDASNSHTVAIRTRSYCVTTTPAKEVWTLIPGQSITVDAIVQNCGTEPITLTGAESTAWKGPGEPSVRIAEKLPFEIEAGETATARVTISPEEAGLFEGTVRFDFAERAVAAGAATRFFGAAAEEGCSAVELPKLDVEVGGDQPLGDFELVPGQLVTLVPRDPGDLRTFFTTVGAPDGYRGRVLTDDDGAGLIAPDVVGDYAVRYQAFDEAAGLLVCDFDEVRFSALPDAPLYVELTWEAAGDPILNDAGFGRGADLDLFVLTGDSSRWNDEEVACFPEASVPCGLTGGVRRSRSLSGDRPEAYAFVDADERYRFGAYLKNPYNFGDGVRANLRVWRDGVLVEEASMSSPSNDEDTLRIRKANSFWFASIYADGVGVPVDSHAPGIP